MSQSKRFVIVSFFVTLTLSALCQSAYDGIKAFADKSTMANGMRLLYAIGLACFLIKYFIDDVVDDNGGQGEVISRRSLASLIIGWMLFLFAAMSAGSVYVSALFWLVGVAVVTWFMFRNRASIPRSCFLRYFGENVFLGAILLSLTLPLFVKSLSGCTVFLACNVACLFLINLCAFAVMLSDGTPDIKG